MGDPGLGVHRFRQAVPHRWQEGAAVGSVLEYQAVLAGADLSDQLGLVADRQAFGRRQDRQMQLDARPFDPRQWRETRIPEGGGEGVLGDIDDERLHQLGYE